MAITNHRLAQFSSHFLETFKNAHVNFVGVLCELIDNSIAVDAKHVWITLQLGDGVTNKKKRVIVHDDGPGMTHNGVYLAFSTGYSSSITGNEHSVAMYGFGLKSALYIGCTVTLMTVVEVPKDQCGNTREFTLGVLSQPYNQKENIPDDQLALILITYRFNPDNQDRGPQAVDVDHDDNVTYLSSPSASQDQKAHFRDQFALAVDYSNVMHSSETTLQRAGCQLDTAFAPTILEDIQYFLDKHFPHDAKGVCLQVSDLNPGVSTMRYDGGSASEPGSSLPVRHPDLFETPESWRLADRCAFKFERSLRRRLAVTYLSAANVDELPVELFVNGTQVPLKPLKVHDSQNCSWIPDTGGWNPTHGSVDIVAGYALPVQAHRGKTSGCGALATKEVDGLEVFEYPSGTFIYMPMDVTKTSGDWSLFAPTWGATKPGIRWRKTKKDSWVPL